VPPPLNAALWRALAGLTKERVAVSTPATRFFFVAS
jgi:hypothetical protein